MILKVSCLWTSLWWDGGGTKPQEIAVKLRILPGHRQRREKEQNAHNMSHPGENLISGNMLWTIVYRWACNKARYLRNHACWLFLTADMQRLARDIILSTFSHYSDPSHLSKNSPYLKIQSWVCWEFCLFSCYMVAWDGRKQTLLSYVSYDWPMHHSLLCAHESVSYCVQHEITFPSFLRQRATFPMQKPNSPRHNVKPMWR